MSVARIVLKYEWRPFRPMRVICPFNLLGGHSQAPPECDRELGGLIFARPSPDVDRARRHVQVEIRLTRPKAAVPGLASFDRKQLDQIQDINPAGVGPRSPR